MDRTIRPPGGRVSSARLAGFVLVALVVAATAGIAASCSDYAIKPFKCGVGLASDKDVAQSCTEPRQVCICETNDCAEIVDEAVCESGYRYVKAPFADPPESTPPTDAGADADSGTSAAANQDARCVPKAIGDRTATIASTEDNKFCPGEEPKGGADGGTSTSSGGGSTGGTGGTTGTGGATTSMAGGGTGGGK